MKRFVRALVAVAIAQSVVATSHAEIIDLPNPESTGMDLPPLPLPMGEVTPSVIIPAPPSTQERLGCL